MTQAKFTVSSKLMQNYEAASPIDYHGAIAATSDSSGNLLFFSIGSDGHIYAFTPMNNTATGWQRINLSQGMDDFTAVLLAAEQDEHGAPLLAAVMKSKSTQEYSVFLARDFAEATGKARWVFRGKKGGLQVTNIVAGHGKQGAALIVITTQKGDQSTNFLVNPDITDVSWFWREVPSPVNGQRVLSTAIGHNARLESLDEVQGLLYSLYQTDQDGQTWMVVTSLPDFTFYNHAIPLGFNPTAFGVTRGSEGDTELIVGDTKLYHLTPQLQLSRDADEVKQGMEPVTSQPAAHKVQAIEIGVMNDRLLEAWFLTEDGRLSRAYQGPDRKWLSPLPFQSQVGEMVAWRSDDKRLQEIFTVSLDNHLRRYRRDPSTTLWKGLDIMVESLDAHRETKTYVTQLQLTDESGAPLANQKVTVRASELTPLKINHRMFYADPNSDAVVCQTDALGNLIIENTVSGLSTPTVRLQADVLGSQVIDVDPAAEARHTLSTLSLEQLQNAQMQTDTLGVTEPLLPGKSKEDLQGTHEALKQLTSLSSQLPSRSAPSKPQHFVTQAAGSPMLNRVAHGALPADYRWSLDLKGAQPAFTRHQLQALAIPLSARSVLDDVGHFFGDVWHAIEHGFIQVEHFVVQKVSDGIQLIISAAETAYQVVVQFAEQVWSVIQYVFQKIGAFFEELVRWLGFIFAWKDILRTHDVTRTMINHGLDKFVSKLSRAEDHVHAFFTKLKNHILGQDLASKAGGWADGNIKSLQTTGGHPSPLRSPDVYWAVHQAQSGNLIKHGDAAPVSTSISLPKTIQQDAEQLQSLFSSAVQDLLHQKISLREFLKRVLAVLEVAVLDTAEAVALGVVEAVKLAVEAVRTVLNARWHIPLISPLYKVITRGSELTLLDLISLLAAIPATILYKVATNHAPFSEAEAQRLTRTKSLDELVGVFVDLDKGPVSVAGLSAASAGPVAAAAARTNLEKVLPNPARGISYAIGFIAALPWLVYGLTNALSVALNSNDQPVADKIKVATGLFVNALAFVPMEIVLAFAAHDIPFGSKASLPRYEFEMFITLYQYLFNAKDALMMCLRETNFGAVILDVLESFFGVINCCLFVALAIAEGVADDLSVGNGLKLLQNLPSGLTQGLSALGDVLKGTSRVVLVAAQAGLGATPGPVSVIRAIIEINSNAVLTTR